MNNFHDKEALCRAAFAELGTVYHFWTPENFEIFIRSEDDFKSAMNIIGIYARQFPDIRILTFEVMTNHLHFCSACDKSRFNAFFDQIRNAMRKHFRKCGYTNDWSAFQIKERLLSSLEDVRNVIIYDNRNGYIVNPEYSPFSYPWGANKYFFNPDTCKYAYDNMRKMTIGQIRESASTRLLDYSDSPGMVDGYSCPLAFCRIDISERLFRDSSHYFYRLGKNIEANKEIAAELGESVFYTDDELFSAVSSVCRSKHGTGNPSAISSSAKIEIARMMRFDYNASDKQICRILHVSPQIISQM